MITADKEYSSQKNKKKARRVVIQLLILAALASVVYFAIFTTEAYRPYDESAVSMSRDKGFVAISYSGVDRTANERQISEEMLAKHLAALSRHGYVTISQKDITDFYESGKSLPSKSLFLLFEDGRRNTAIFSARETERFNFLATMSSFAENTVRKHPTFLRPKDLESMLETGFWELGTNGNRLVYINVTDESGTFIKEVSARTQKNLQPSLWQSYSYYMTDYLRDGQGKPAETKDMLGQRLSGEYEALRTGYTEALGALPQLHVFFAANSGRFGKNDDAGKINEQWLKNLFRINFSREGKALNNRKQNVYELTRLQVQPHWQTNHLLMRLRDETGEEVLFNRGEEKRYGLWRLEAGAAEFLPEKIVLTSPPEKSGRLRLEAIGEAADLKVAATLSGLRQGKQKMYLRLDKEGKNFISVGIINDILFLREQTGRTERDVFVQKLSREGDGLFDFGARGNKAYAIAIELKGDKARLQLAGKEIYSGTVRHTGAGAVALESAWNSFGSAKSAPVDNVYDGIFERLKVTGLNADGTEKVLYDDEMHGLEAFLHKLDKGLNSLIDWFIVYL